VHHSKFWRQTSALGQKQTLADVRVMSALPPKADISWLLAECPLCAKADMGRYAGSVEYVARPSATKLLPSLNTSTSTTPTLLPLRRTRPTMVSEVLIAGLR